jgi:hypothetical protein
MKTDNNPISALPVHPQTPLIQYCDVSTKHFNTTMNKGNNTPQPKATPFLHDMLDFMLFCGGSGCTAAAIYSKMQIPIAGMATLIPSLTRELMKQ